MTYWIWDIFWGQVTLEAKLSEKWRRVGQFWKPISSFIFQVILLFDLMSHVQVLNLDMYSVSGCGDTGLVDTVMGDSAYVNKDLLGGRKQQEWLHGYFKCVSRSHNLLQVNKLHFRIVFGNYCIHTSDVRPRHYGWLEFIWINSSLPHS